MIQGKGCCATSVSGKCPLMRRSMICESNRLRWNNRRFSLMGHDHVTPPLQGASWHLAGHKLNPPLWFDVITEKFTSLRDKIIIFQKQPGVRLTPQQLVTWCTSNLDWNHRSAKPFSHQKFKTNSQVERWPRGGWTPSRGSRNSWQGRQYNPFHQSLSTKNHSRNNYKAREFLGLRGPLREPMSVRPAHEVFIINRYLGIGRSNQKISKNQVHFFRILLLGGPSPPSQLVPKHRFFYRHLGISHSNEK